MTPPSAKLIVPALLVALGGGLWAGSEILPGASPVRSIDQVRSSYRASDAIVLDRHGEIVHEQRTDRRQRRLAWTPLDEIPAALVDAVVASEDRRFWRHDGVDLAAVAHALWQRLRGDGSRGASTITMQLVGILEAPDAGGRPRRGIPAKLRQIAGALRLEQAWSKEDVLEAYLNLAPLRGEIVGIAAASQLLLGKAPHAISREEAVALASLLRAPNALRRDVERRASRLAAQMQPTADPEGTSRAVARMTDASRSQPPRVALAPHAARRLLARHPGASRILSTLDAGVQRVAVEALDRNLQSLAGRNVRDGAAIVVENATGNVLAWVGAPARGSAPHVDAVLAHRQAGSTLKPFLYALALERRGLTAASLLDDRPVALAEATGLYRPHNYDESYRGIVSVRTALASSLNVPAVRAITLLGATELAAMLREVGFARVDQSGDYYGPALALGAAEVSLAELAGAYLALASGGRHRRLRLDPLETIEMRPTALSPEATFIVSDVLADRESRSATFGLESPLATRFWSAVKTGTSKDMRDNWCIGFSTSYTVGVWVGNASGEPMHDVSGVSGAAPAWLEILSALQGDLPDERPTPPPKLVRRSVTFPTAAEPERTEWFLPGTEPPAATIALAAARPRITSPPPGSLFALDPDIPARNQRVAFTAHVDREDLRWRVDDADAGHAQTPMLWPPAPGRHRLALVRGDGSVVDEVAFEVRSVAPPSRDPRSSRRPPRSLVR